MQPCSVASAGEGTDDVAFRGVPFFASLFFETTGATVGTSASATAGPAVEA